MRINQNICAELLETTVSKLSLQMDQQIPLKPKPDVNNYLTYKNNNNNNNNNNDNITILRY